MAQRTVAYCDGKYIGIESIYTIIDGKQVNIPEKVMELRKKSRNHELLCPCGCGAHLTLVAGDKNLREQHFRLSDEREGKACVAVTEGKTSIYSKIVLKCWLDDTLKASDIESRVPICEVGDSERKYEFTFLSESSGIAVNYCYDRANLSEEKMQILAEKGSGIHIIHIVDQKNGGDSGQYPEGLMKVQRVQGYCLLLTVKDADYEKARLTGVVYQQDLDGLWHEIPFVKGFLSDFSINGDGKIIFQGKVLSAVARIVGDNFLKTQEIEKKRREAEDKRRAEFQRKIREEEERKRKAWRAQREAAELEKVRREAEEEKRRLELQEKQRKEAERKTEEKRQREEEFKKNMEEGFQQQESPILDCDGIRWAKCEFCGKIAKAQEYFQSFGGPGHVNLGTCKECSSNNPAVLQKIEELGKKKIAKIEVNPNICPWCGAWLRERNGVRGNFLGCSNFPRCRYTRNCF
jgi:hypothetical protein